MKIILSNLIDNYGVFLKKLPSNLALPIIKKDRYTIFETILSNIDAYIKYMDYQFDDKSQIIQFCKSNHKQFVIDNLMVKNKPYYSKMTNNPNFDDLNDLFDNASIIKAKNYFFTKFNDIFLFHTFNEQNKGLIETGFNKGIYFSTDIETDFGSSFGDKQDLISDNIIVFKTNTNKLNINKLYPDPEVFDDELDIPISRIVKKYGLNRKFQDLYFSNFNLDLLYLIFYELDKFKESDSYWFYYYDKISKPNNLGNFIKI